MSAGSTPSVALPARSHRSPAGALALPRRGGTGGDRPGASPGPVLRGGAPEPVEAILRRVLKEIPGGPPIAAGKGRRTGPGGSSAIASAWYQASEGLDGLPPGTDLLAETRPVSLRHGVLTVEVRSNALLLELDGFRRDELLRRVLAVSPGGRITGLRFRPGVF